MVSSGTPEVTHASYCTALYCALPYSLHSSTLLFTHLLSSSHPHLLSSLPPLLLSFDHPYCPSSSPSRSMTTPSPQEVSLSVISWTLQGILDSRSWTRPDCLTGNAQLFFVAHTLPFSPPFSLQLFLSSHISVDSSIFLLVVYFYFLSFLFVSFTFLF